MAPPVPVPPPPPPSTLLVVLPWVRQHGQLRAAFGVHEKPVFFGIGGTRQNDVGPLRAPITMAALIDHERTSRDLDLISTKVEDHLGPFGCLGQTAFGHCAHVHRANARGVAPRFDGAPKTV